jgi:hypothetical protein
VSGNATISGGTVSNVTISGSNANLVNLTAVNVTITGTSALQVPVGTTAQRPTGAAGEFRFNSNTASFEGYDGLAWGAIGGGGSTITVTNDTSTNTAVFPVFANVTTGTVSNIFTSNASMVYLPSEGEFKANVVTATNGIVVNSQNVAASYTIATGFNGLSAGPVTVNGGVNVTVSTGSVWTVV